MTLQDIKTSVMKFVNDEEGLTVVEYAVAGGLIALAVILAFQTLGGTAKNVICEINDALVAGGATEGAGGGC